MAVDIQSCSCSVCVCLCAEDISHPRVESIWILVGRNCSNLYAAPNPCAQTQTHTLDLRWAATSEPSDLKILFILSSSLFVGVVLVLGLCAGSKKKKISMFVRRKAVKNKMMGSSWAAGLYLQVEYAHSTMLHTFCPFYTPDNLKYSDVIRFGALLVKCRIQVWFES